MGDRASIIETVTRYATALDAHDLAGLDSVFTEDVVCELGGTPIRGREVLKKTLQRMLGGGGPSQHLLGNHVVRIEGDTARCVSQVRAFSAGAGEAAGRTYELFGEYRDELVRTDEGWRIVHRELTVRHEIGDRAVLSS